jgi:multidrug resistance efflux pump
MFKQFLSLRSIFLVGVMAAGCSPGSNGLGHTNVGRATSTTNVRVRTATVEVVIPRQGALAELLVPDHSQVTAGTPLMRIVHPTVEREAAEQQTQVTIADEVARRARISVRSKLAASRGQWYEVAAAQANVRMKVSSLRSAVAALRRERVKEAAAEDDYNRVTKLANASVVPVKDIEDMKEAFDIAREQVHVAEEQVQQIRAQLGLDPGEDTDDTPEDLDQTATDVQVELSEWAQSIVEIGFPLRLVNLRPDEARKKLYGHIDGKSLDEILDTLEDQNPDVKLAEANLAKVRAEYERLQSMKRETVLTAPTAGIVQFHVHRPGAPVAAEKVVASVYPIDQVWVEAWLPVDTIDEIHIGEPIRLTSLVDSSLALSGHVVGPACRAQELETAGATGVCLLPTTVTSLPVKIELAEKDCPRGLFLAGLPLKVTVVSPSGGSSTTAKLGQKVWAPPVLPKKSGE